MTISIWQADNTQPVRDVDFLIIGGGLAGTSAAYFAKQAGHDVVITEMRDLAMGASGRNAGFIITGLDSYYHRAVEEYGAEVAYEMWKLSQETIAFWKQIAADSPAEVPLNVCGSMLLAESEEEAQDLERAYNALKDAGISAIFHSSDPLKRGYFAGIEQPLDASVQPVKLVHALFEASGAELVSNNEVYQIVQDAPDCVTVYSQRYIFKARYVLICTNAFAPRMEPYFVDKVIPTRAQVLVTEPLEKWVIDYCGYSNYGYMYYRMTFDNRFLLGGARHLYRAHEHDTTEDRLNELIQEALDKYMAQYFPDVTAPIHRRWTGIMGFSVDGLPMAGILPDKSRVGFAVGFTGHGLALGAGTTKRAVHKLLFGEDAGAVDARRFEQGVPQQRFY